MTVTKRFILLLFMFLSVTAYAQDEEADKFKFKLGGALRFNYNYSDWNRGHQKRGGDFGYDVLLLRPQASYKGFLLDADYRFYVKEFGGPMLKYGWMGYQFNSKSQLQLGLTRVPFGIQPINSHCFLFTITYYVGLEDDADMGLKYVYAGDRWEYNLAFYKNADEVLFSPTAETTGDRYGYDIAGRNKEINQFNAQLFYKWGTNVKQRIGASAQFGQIYNLDTERRGTHYAFALHHELNWQGLSLKTQIATYAKNPKNLDGQSRDTIMMTAYGAPYSIASKANVYTLGIGYTIPVKWGPIHAIQFYNDFGWLQKWKKEFNDSFQNISGIMIAAGPVYAYIDYALGLHQAWLGPDWSAFAEGTGSNSWHARFNINFGYYF